MTNLCLERARLHSFLKEGVGGVVLKGGGDVLVAHGFIRAAKCPKMTRASSGLGTGPIGHNYTGVPDPRECRSALPDDLAASRRADGRRMVRGTSRGLLYRNRARGRVAALFRDKGGSSTLSDFVSTNAPTAGAHTLKELTLILQASDNMAATWKHQYQLTQFVRVDTHPLTEVHLLTTTRAHESGGWRLGVRS
jgi:hypothetical protein